MGMSCGGGIQKKKGEKSQKREKRKKKGKKLKRKKGKGQGGLLIMLLWWHDSQWLPYMVRLNLGEWGVYTDTDGSLCNYYNNNYIVSHRYLFRHPTPEWSYHTCCMVTTAIQLSNLRQLSSNPKASVFVYNFAFFLFLVVFVLHIL